MGFESTSRADLQNLRSMRLVTGRLQHRNSRDSEKQLIQAGQLMVQSGFETQHAEFECLLLQIDSSDSEAEQVETELFLRLNSNDLEMQAFPEQPTRRQSWCCWFA